MLSILCNETIGSICVDDNYGSNWNILKKEFDC